MTIQTHQGTKEKRTKIDSLRPPREIVSNTKARRAWLAEQLATVKATPERDGKIVGIGSYQTVSVYEVIQVAGRVRHRGICQYCGGSQVVDDSTGLVVLHGYKRPGDGFTRGQCFAQGEKPLNVEKTITETCSQQADDRLAKAQQREKDATKAYDAAMAAKYPGGSKVTIEQNAHLTKPKSPRVGKIEALWTDAEKQSMAVYRAARKVWRQTFPLTAAVEYAETEISYSRQNEWQCRQESEHFHTLLNSGTFGTELEQEVVA